MEAAGFLMLITLFGVSIYDFNILKKSKVKISKCFSGAFFTLFINIVIFIIAMALEQVIYGYTKDHWVIIGMILIGAFNYFRFKGRKLR